MTKIIKIILLLSILFFAVSFFQKDKLPDSNDILEELYQDPIQIETSEPPFEIKKEEITYTITPLYSYEIYGMITTYNRSTSWFDYYHEKWKDFLNVKDLCVIWGDNIRTEVYKSMKFKSGSFTCYAKFKSNTTQDIWSKFRNDNLSNNHLLTDNEEINEMIMKAEKGDQVYIKGYLVSYSHSNGSFYRGSSISRTDKGDKACETIYVTDFKILKKANSLWHSVYSFFGYLIIICLVLLFISFLYSVTATRKSI